MSRFADLYQACRRVGDRLVGDVLDLVFPRLCRTCASGLAEECGPLCSACADTIVWIDVACFRCGAAVLNPSPDGHCHECRGRRLHFDHCRAAAVYDSCLRELVLLHKYRGVPQVCAFLADLLEELWAAWQIVPEAGRPVEPPVLVPVPAHPLRPLLRGRDPLQELVEELSERVHLPVSALLRRRRYTRSQTRLPRARRVRNPRGTMRLTRRVTVPPHVILIDDVLTTCATVSEAAKVLRSGGAQRIDVLAVARSVGV